VNSRFEVELCMGDPRDIDDHTEAMRLCPRCGGNAFYWRTAIVAGTSHAPAGSNAAKAHQQPAWTCLSCGLIEPHERRALSAGTPERRSSFEQPVGVRRKFV